MIDPIPAVNSTEFLLEVATEAVTTTINSVPYMWEILKTAGILFIAYVLFLFIKGLLTFKTNRRIKRMEFKIDLLLKKEGIDFQKERKLLKEKKKKVFFENPNIEEKTKNNKKIKSKTKKKS